ncbi:hypothetical protein [Mitsuokella jalaludinii]|uniref:hypothetical protein n=1 Tax=Mitsuokella jalaludinii TaxID=187979 RepID=UPI003F970ED3
MEVRYFYINHANRPVSPFGQAVWSYLMNRANSGFWRLPLVLSTNEAAGAIGISPSSFRRVREELQEKRCLYFEQKDGEKCARYYLYSQMNPGTLIGRIAKRDMPDARWFVRIGQVVQERFAEEDLPQKSGTDSTGSADAAGSQTEAPEPPEEPLTPEEIHVLAGESLAHAPGCEETAVESWQRLTGQLPAEKSENTEKTDKPDKKDAGPSPKSTDGAQMTDALQQRGVQPPEPMNVYYARFGHRPRDTGAPTGSPLPQKGMQP